MISLILLSLLGSGLTLSVPSRSEQKTTIPDRAYVLPWETYPTFYDVRLFLDPGNKEYFTGDVSIRLFSHVDTSTIVLHAMAMNITELSLFDDGNIDVNIADSFNHATDDTHFLTVTSKVPLIRMRPYILKIEYKGTYATNMFGIYVSTYERPGVGPVDLITSQLQPTFARRAFPCYDEPRYKAVFRTTIYAPPGYDTVRTNMPQKTTNLIKPEVAGFVKYEFEDTLKQSTYLLAYLVSDFDFVTNEVAGVPTGIFPKPFRVYSRPGTQSTAAFALDYGPKNVIALQNYTKFEYALPKFDKAAVPDFAAGAMENWGLVIYREVALLVQDGVTTTATKQNVARIICHENLHMWFGNEVSPISWTYTWLNEGFANFFENYGTDMVLPWRMMDQYVLLMQNVMQSDAIRTINPMTHPVFTPSQIISTFNAVAYQKSGSVIRMMQHFLTPDVFQQGLVYYLANNTRRAVTPDELYVHLQAALNESNHTIPWSVEDIMENWTRQGGFPVITVRRLAPTAQSISISQQRYLTNPRDVSRTTWHVPINWVLSTNPDFSDTKPLVWLPPTGPALAVDIPALSDVEWFIVNKQQASYYRVNYDDGNWRALARVLFTSHETIHLLNRAQIVDDVFNMARNGRTSYSNAFEVSRYLVNETDYIAWGSANSAFSYLDVVLSGSPAYEAFQAYVLHLTGPSYNRLGFVANPAAEEHVTAAYRNVILNLNCRLGNQHCVNESQTLLEQFRNNPSQHLNPDIQMTVFCSGLRGGSAQNFDFLWNRYLASQDSSEQAILLNSLGCTSNETLRSQYLNQVIDDNSAVREQDRHTILVSTINASPANMEAALDFVVENFAAIQTRVQGLTGTTNILNAFARRLSTNSHRTIIAEFSRRYDSIFTAGERASVNDIRDNIDASIRWSADNFDIVHSWLRLNYGSNASIMTSGFLIVISIFVTWYNH
ncbi:aminopeptidase N-like [Maniola hyperantus]|uniref:aminopeptidase N-like n=1 Tax=Aphantopus hyperantus TaxID=2795564 RepID=UPI00156892AE|nr:aminopeptidase N-like [Maniola hyperantus]